MRKCRPRSCLWPIQRSNVVRIFACAFTIPILGSCESSIGDSPNLPEPGELNSGTFHYDCLDLSDASSACSKSGQFPIALAVGGRFGLNFYPNESGQVLPQLASATPNRLAEHASGYFTMLAPGYTAVLVLSGGSVVDFKHLRAANIDHLEVKRIGDTLKLNQIELGLGTSIRLEASPHESYSDQALAGSLDYRWTSGDPSLLSIASDETNRQIELSALSLGQTTITVVTGTVQLTVPVSIREANDDESESESSTTGEESGDSGQVDTSSSGSEGSDTGMTAGTESDTDTSSETTSTGTDAGETTQGTSSRGIR